MKRSTLPTALLASLALAGSATALSDGHASAALFHRVEGERIRAAIRIEIDEGWHLYHQELGPPDAVGKPTTAELQAEDVRWEPVRFPEPERLPQLGIGEGGGDTWIWAHEGTIVLRATGALEGEPPSSVLASLSGLTCEDNGTCVPWDLEIESSGSGPDALFEAADEPDPAAAGAADAHAGGEADATLWLRRSGDRVELAAEVEITPGWVLYHTEKGRDDAVGVPLSIELLGEGVRWDEPALSPPERKVQESLGAGGGDTWIWAHTDRLWIRASGTVEEGAEPSGVAMALSGQTCSEVDGVCVFYEETAYPRGEGPDEAFAAEVGSAPSAEGEGAVQGLVTGEGRSLLGFLLAAVLAGLFTLAMPCTYPMIPITISFFTKQADARHGRVLPLALAYGIGIVLCFVAVGIVFGSVIIPFATHPVTNLVIGVLFVLFALVLFGVVDLRPPRVLMSAAGTASQRGGLPGVFLMGALLCVTSFTCTAPFMGTVLALGAAEGDLGRVVLGLAVFGATMAIPFVALSLVPERVKSLPRSGEWMHVVKVFLGFVELAAALKFLSNSDLVWSWNVLSRELFLLLWIGIFVVAALYVLGLVRLHGERAGEIGPVRMVVGLSTLLFALYCGYGLMGYRLDPVMMAIVPPYSGDRPGGGAVAAAGAERAGHEVVVDDYDLALERARAEDKLLLVNFTGHTCVNCRQMETVVFERPEVARRLEGFVEARLHTDGRANIERILELQEELAGIRANPFYVILDPAGERTLGRFGGGGIQLADEFVAFLDSALEV